MATFEVTGGWGELVCDIATGNVVSYDRGGDWEKEGDGYDSIVRLDVDEWRKTYPRDDITAGHDILDFGSWDKAGRYVGPEEDWRFNFWHDRGDMESRLGPDVLTAFKAWVAKHVATGMTSADKPWGY